LLLKYIVDDKARERQNRSNAAPIKTLRSGKSFDSNPVRLNGSNPSVHSEENKSFSDFETPEEVEQIYREIFKDVPEAQQNLTSLSQKSKQSGILNSYRDLNKDWSETPLHDEYERVGNNLEGSRFDAEVHANKGGRRNNSDENRYYTEAESRQVYEFVRNRYNGKEYDKSVTSFSKKAMETLRWIYEDQLDLNTFQKIKKMYSKVDVTNTLKLLLRCQLIYQARRNIMNIFENIRLFKLLKTKAKNLINLHIDFKGDVSQTTQRLKNI